MAIDLVKPDGGKITDIGVLISATLLSKPVLGGTSADIVQGSPISSPRAGASKECAAELIRKAKIVQGLADAATAIITINPVAAAGLAMAAADVAEAMTPGLGPQAAPNCVASGFASSALAAAKNGSTMAEGLTEAAISTAVHVAKARSTVENEQHVAQVRRPSTNCSSGEVRPERYDRRGIELTQVDRRPSSSGSKTSSTLLS